MELCRLCLVNSDLVDILANANSAAVVRLINLCTGVEIKATDTMSKQVCRSCLKINDMIWKYRINTSRNNDLLRSEPDAKTSTTNLRTVRVPFRCNYEDFKLLLEKNNRLLDSLSHNFNPNYDMSVLLNEQKLVTNKNSHVTVNSAPVEKVIATKSNVDHVILKRTASNTPNKWVIHSLGKKSSSNLNLANVKPQSGSNSNGNVNLVNLKQTTLPFLPANESIRLIKSVNRINVNVDNEFLNSNFCPLLKIPKITAWQIKNYKQSLKRTPCPETTVNSVSKTMLCNVLTIKEKKTEVEEWIRKSVQGHKNIPMSDLISDRFDTIPGTEENTSNAATTEERVRSDCASSYSNASTILNISSSEADDQKMSLIKSTSHTTGTSSRRRKRRRTAIAPSESDNSEVMPTKKLRSFCKTGPVFQKVDLNVASLNDSAAQKDVFVSSLELRRIGTQPAEEPLKSILIRDGSASPEHDLLSNCRSIDIYICDLCQAVLDSKKSLAEHRKKHSTCPHCYGKFRNAEVLSKHWDGNCIAKKPVYVVVSRLKEQGPPERPKHPPKSCSFALELSPNKMITTDMLVKTSPPMTNCCNLLCDAAGLQCQSVPSSSFATDSVNDASVRRLQFEEVTVPESDVLDFNLVISDDDEVIEVSDEAETKPFVEPFRTTSLLVGIGAIDEIIDLSRDDDAPKANEYTWLRADCSDLSENNYLVHLFKKYYHNVVRVQASSQTFVPKVGRIDQTFFKYPHPMAKVLDLPIVLKERDVKLMYEYKRNLAINYNNFTKPANARETSRKHACFKEWQNATVITLSNVAETAKQTDNVVEMPTLRLRHPTDNGDESQTDTQQSEFIDIAEYANSVNLVPLTGNNDLPNEPCSNASTQNQTYNAIASGNTNCTFVNNQTILTGQLINVSNVAYYSNCTQPAPAEQTPPNNGTANASLASYVVDNCGSSVPNAHYKTPTSPSTAAYGVQTASLRKIRPARAYASSNSTLAKLLNGSALQTLQNEQPLVNTTFSNVKKFNAVVEKDKNVEVMQRVIRPNNSANVVTDGSQNNATTQTTVLPKRQGIRVRDVSEINR